MIKKCPRCKSDQIITNAGCCSVCGTNVTAAGPDEGDQLDLIVREVPEDDREFVGGDKPQPSGDQPERGDPNPPLREKKTGSEEEPARSNRAYSYDPIGFSEPSLSPDSESTMEPEKSGGSKPIEKAKAPETKRSSASGKFKKLTPEEVQAIEKNLYGRNTRLADQEKASIRSKINDIENQASSLSSPQSKFEKSPLLSETLNPAELEPGSAGRGRSVAFFYKNFIKLPPQHHLTRHDELLLNGKLYALQPKRLKPTYVYVGAGVLFTLALMFIGSWFIKDVDDGRGQIAGMVLDSNNKPYIKGASVRFPDLGVTVKSNAQGLFNSDDMPAGSHRVEYLIDGRVVGSDHATVLENSISMLALRPSTTKPEIKKQSQFSTKSTNSKTGPSASSSNQIELEPDQISGTSQTKLPPETKKSSKQGPAAPSNIVLVANVDGAKFTLDGKVLGAGNLKYSPIEPGTHKYEIVAPGYKKKSGSVTVGAGETKTLEVELETLAETVKQTIYGAEDFFQSGVNALKAGSYENSISDFTKALEINPSYPQAIYNRGLAYQQLKRNSEAHDDFVQAAEVYKIKKESSWAITAYNRAIEVNNQSITALLGRGDLYLTKGEEIAALADFDAVVQKDKRNYPAHVGLGKSRFQQGNYKLAIENFKNARAINKDDPYLYQYLMLCYMSLSDIKEVKKAYDRFQEIATENQRNSLANDKRFTAAIAVAKKQ